MKLEEKQVGWFAGALLLSLTACNVSAEKFAAIAHQLPIPSVLTATLSRIKQGKPLTLTAPINIEGEQTQVTLHRFDDASLPFTTYIPTQDFTPVLDTSEEGRGVRFYFSPTGTPDRNAFIWVVFLNRLIDPTAVVFDSSMEEVDRSDTTPYAWATERIDYRQNTAQGALMSTVFFGEYQGRVFLVMTHYPAEYADGFEPRAAIVLQHLELRP